MALKFNQLKKKKSPAPQPPSRPVSAAGVPKSVTKSSLASATTVSEIEVVNVRHAPEWVSSAQEEIHTLIAQRHFEDALTLITKCDEYFAKDNSFHNASETIQKVQRLNFNFVFE